MAHNTIEFVSPAADTVFFNGKIITVNAKDEIAEALAVRGCRVLRVGDRSYVEQTIASSTRVVDLAGRAMVTGFIDNHIHMTNSPQRQWVDCTYSSALAFWHNPKALATNLFLILFDSIPRSLITKTNGVIPVCWRLRVTGSERDKKRSQ